MKVLLISIAINFVITFGGYIIHKKMVSILKKENLTQNDYGTYYYYYAKGF
jgi:hypothetical protein